MEYEYSYRDCVYSRLLVDFNGRTNRFWRFACEAVFWRGGERIGEGVG